MKRKLLLSLLAAATMTVAAKPSLPQIEVSRLVTDNGKTYVEVDGKPFPYLGAEIRLDALLNCDKMEIEEVEKYIAKASELGLNCVLIPIYWNLIEPEEGKYDFSVVDKILEYVNKYDLKMEPAVVQYQHVRRYILLSHASIYPCRSGQAFQPSR